VEEIGKTRRFGRTHAFKIAQLRETWINNIVRINGVSREEAEKMYLKIDPHRDVK